MSDLPILVSLSAHSGQGIVFGHWGYRWIRLAPMDNLVSEMGRQ